jgi:hypothetical protein
MGTVSESKSISTGPFVWLIQPLGATSHAILGRALSTREDSPMSTVLRAGRQAGRF